MPQVDTCGLPAEMDQDIEQERVSAMQVSVPLAFIIKYRFVGLKLIIAMSYDYLFKFIIVGDQSSPG